MTATTDKGRAYRREKSRQWAQNEAVEFVTTLSGKRGHLTLHRFSCPIVQRLCGGYNSSVRRHDGPEQFRKLFDLPGSTGESRFCPTCQPEVER